jgi:hypothetical protein
VADNSSSDNLDLSRSGPSIHYRGQPPRPLLHLGQREFSRPGAEPAEASGSEVVPPGDGSDSPERERSAAESRSARALLKELGEEFVRLRAENRTSAWVAYQRKIACNLYVLIPYAINLKEATGLLIQLEEFMKGEAGVKVATPSEVVREWLNAGVEGRAS